MIDEKRRDMFNDLYRLAEYFEHPPFMPGKIDENADWFIGACNQQLTPFLRKHPGRLAQDLAFAILDDANRQAVAMNEAGG